MSTARKILSNTFFQIIGKIITAGLSIVAVKAITNYLGVNGYGQYTTVYEFLAFFGIAADFGIYTIAVREMSKNEKDIPHIIGNVLSLRTLSAAGLMLISVLMGLIIPKYQGTFIPIGIAIASLSTFFALLAGTISSVLQVFLKMQYYVLTLVLSKIFNVIYILAVIYAFYQKSSAAGFYQLIWAGVLGNLILLGLTWHFTRKFTPLKYRFNKKFLKDVTLKALPYGLALILNTIYFRLDIILLSLLKGSEEVGIYGVAMRMLDVIVIIPSYFMNSIMPVMTRYLEEKNPKIEILLQYALDFLVAAGMPIVVGTVVLAKPIIRLVSSNAFLSGQHFHYGADLALTILIFAMFFSFLNTLFGFLLVALEQQTKLLWVNLGCVIFNLCSNLFIIPLYGFRGAATTSIFSELFVLIGTFWFARKALRFKLKLKNTWKILLAGSVMGICIYYLNLFTGAWGLKNLLLLIPAGGLIYLVGLKLTNVINADILALVGVSKK